MMIEQNTNYAYKLKYIDKPSFDKVRKLAVQFMMELPQQLRDELYDALNHGLDILDSEPQMVTYLYSFGQMHQAKLNYAFGKLPDEFLRQDEINIIDYGCGQAMGTMCYADFLRENGYSQKIKTITLIEPSEMCLKRAALHTSMFFPDVEIKTVNKKFYELDEIDIFCDEDVPTLHIFSNVLDILDFDLSRFTELVKRGWHGYNLCVCVGPFFNYPEKDERMEQFCSLLSGNEYYGNSFGKYEFDEQKAWTAHFLCFAVEKTIVDNLSTEVTKTDIDNGIEDEYGILYSIDGKRLLKCRNYKIESYSIKRGTKVICNIAFGDDFEHTCESLREIVIPDTVTKIGFGAFMECNSLQQVIIPDSVIEIGDIAFWDCKSLQQIFISNSIKIIGEEAFWGCISLRQIIIPDSVISIGERAFSRCFSLKQIIISKGISEKFKGMLDKDLWDKLVELSDSKSNSLPKEIDYPSTEFTEEDIINGISDEYGVVYSRDRKRLLKCKNYDLETYSIKYGTEVICECAFGDVLEMSCKSLQQIVIPDSVTKIGNRTFFECESLIQINIPGSVTSIGDFALYGCKSLKQIHLPDSLTSIGKSALSGCESLKHITIPKSITRIGDAVFSRCDSLITVNSNSPRYSIVGSFLIDVVEFKIVTYFGKDNNIIIPNLVKAIGDYAFHRCKSLQQIAIPDSVTIIGKGAFCKCESLKQIVIPDSVTNIKDAVFMACSSLKKITLPNTITSIGNDAFCGCKSLQEIKIPNTVTNIGKSAFRGCSSLQRVSIPNSVSEIGDCAFGGCESLQSITIPQGTREKFKNILLNH